MISPQTAASGVVETLSSDIASAGDYNELRFSALGNTSPAAIRYHIGTAQYSTELSMLTQGNGLDGLVDRVHVDTHGWVGIGIATPISQFHVKTNNTTDIDMDALTLQNAQALGGGRYTSLQFHDGTHAVARVSTKFDGSKTNLYIGSFYSGRYTEISESSFVFTGDGKLGVGTLTPSAKLDVQNGNISTNYGVVASTGSFLTGLLIPSSTAAGISTLTSRQAGNGIVICTDCAIPYSLCVSTGTAAGSWVLAMTAASPHCQ